jgi:hypothetical protein
MGARKPELDYVELVRKALHEKQWCQVPMDPGLNNVCTACDGDDYNGHMPECPIEIAQRAMDQLVIDIDHLYNRVENYRGEREAHRNNEERLKRENDVLRRTIASLEQQLEGLNAAHSRLVEVVADPAKTH